MVGMKVEKGRGQRVGEMNDHSKVAFYGRWGRTSVQFFSPPLLKILAKGTVTSVLLNRYEQEEEKKCSCPHRPVNNLNVTTRLVQTSHRCRYSKVRAIAEGEGQPF